MYQEPPPSPGEIGRLQQQVLEAVLSGGALPGGSEPVAFPDLGFVARGAGVPVLDENFQGEPPPGLGVRVVSRGELEREAAERGEVGYLRFGPPAVSGGEVRLTLEARLATADAARAPMGLSGMQFVLRREGGEWRGSPAAAVAM